MKLTPHLSQYPRKVQQTMGLLWLLILVKCALVTWAIGHWHMPFHAGWVVGPTLVFAGLATALWIAHRED